jgi:hypothetical protein
MESDFRLALALDPSNYSAQAGLILYFALMGQRPGIGRRNRARYTRQSDITLVLQNVALQLPYLGRSEEGAKTADWVLRIDPQMPRRWIGGVAPAYFFARKFDRVIAVDDQVPEEGRFFLAPSYEFLNRAEDAARAKADLIAKNGEQVLEIWFHEGEVFARTTEQGIEREGFRSSGFASAPPRTSSRNSTTRSACPNASRLETSPDRPPDEVKLKAVR